MHPRHPGMASASSSCATGTSAQAPSPTPLDERLPSQRRSVRRQPAASAVLRVALSAKSCQSVSEIQTLIPKIFIFSIYFSSSGRRRRRLQLPKPSCAVIHGTAFFAAAGAAGSRGCSAGSALRSATTRSQGPPATSLLPLRIIAGTSWFLATSASPSF